MDALNTNPEISNATIDSTVDIPMYAVSPVLNYLSDFRGKYLIILKAANEMGPNMPLPERLAFMDREVAKLKDEFKKIRTKEYEAKTYVESITHSCTSDVRGRVKDCGYKDIISPNPDLYTRLDWLSVAGMNKGTKVSPDGSTASLRMTVAGANRNVGTLTAIFRYRPEKILTNVENDLPILFNEVVKK